MNTCRWCGRSYSGSAQQRNVGFLSVYCSKKCEVEAGQNESSRSGSTGEGLDVNNPVELAILVVTMGILIGFVCLLGYLGR